MRTRRLLKPGLCLLLIALCGARAAAEPTPDAVPIVGSASGKKLLRVGSESISQMLGSPSIAEANLSRRVAAWQAIGIDGVVFTIASHAKPDGYRNVCGQWWNPMIERSYEEFAPEVEAFGAVEDWGRLTDNFLWSSIALWDEKGMTAQDWFNDEHWRVILHNVRLQARIAREAGFRGILLDVEQYDHHGEGPWKYPFNYGHYRDEGYRMVGESSPRPPEAVIEQVYHRARQYAEAICSEFPDMTFILIPALYRPKGLIPDEELLYPAFLDGILAGLTPEAGFVGGVENTYSESRYDDIAVIRDSIMAEFTSRSRNPALMKEKLSIAVGIWTDAGTYSETDASQNHRDPKRHEHAVHNALAASHDYAWIYGEKSRFLDPEPNELMRAYWQATNDGRQPHDLTWTPEPRWDMTDYTAFAKQMQAADGKFWADIGGQGYTTAFTFPQFWHFYFDVERRGRAIHEMYPHDAWPLMSTLVPWQAQSIKANGEGTYRTYFDAPSDIDPVAQEVYLAFGSFPEITPDNQMIVRLNGKGYPIDHLVDVSASIKPGERNFLAVEVVNKSGPGGPLGQVKLLTRKRQ